MDPLAEFALLVKAVYREIERQINDAMQPLGLTSAQADAIFVIGEREPLSLKELGGLLIAEAGHPSRLVDRLVDAGIVERRIPDGDRRRVELSLTKEGRRLHKRALAARRGAMERGYEVIGTDDLAPALELMRGIVERGEYAGLVARRRDAAQPKTTTADSPAGKHGSARS